MIKENQLLLQTNTANISKLYDGYAGMLLGYIHEIVKDRKVAEDYLVKIFSDVAKQFNTINWDDTNTWCQLQRFAKTELTAFTDAVESCETPATTTTRHGSPNKYLDQMSEEQKHVFCSFYYNKKSSAQLAIELNISEELIKRSLKEAFAIIRSQHGN